MLDRPAGDLEQPKTNKKLRYKPPETESDILAEKENALASFQTYHSLEAAMLIAKVLNLQKGSLNDLDIKIVR